jgi:hypothetical protein
MCSRRVAPDLFRVLRGMAGAFLAAIPVRSPPVGRKRISVSLAAVGLATFGLLASPETAAAAPIACSTPALVSAIAAASGGGSVTLASGCVYTLTAANNSTDGGGGTGLPVITGSVTVAGTGATITRSTAAGTPTFRIFDVASSGNLTLDSLTVSNGLLDKTGSTGGAGIYNHGILSISGSTFTGNSSPSPNGVSGGGISNTGQLTVTTSTFTNNSAQEGGAMFNQNTATITQTTFANNVGTIYGGGAILNAFGTTNVSTSAFVGNTGPGGGAIDNDTTMTFRNSTFYNNTGGSAGGGAINNFGTVTFIQSTLSGNTASTGANIHNFSFGSVTATTTLIMSIVANGVGGSNCNSNGPPIVDSGYNLDSGSSCGFTTAQHSLNNTQPQLLALASNGGPTQTMALPLQSAAVNAIPTSVSGCSGSTDQRGVARPQGSGCDIGAYEVIISGGDTQPPTIPTGLTATSVTAHAVSLQWNASTDNVAVTGYTVYRNGTVVGSTGGALATTFTDVTVAPSTAYSFTVDAFDGAGNHSAQSAALPVTTSATTGIQWAEGGAVGTSTKVTSTTIPLGATVHAGDLLVGWFGQYDSAGQVQVSDNVNGPWTRSASMTWSTAGDLALYYVQNAAASPTGVTVTIAASMATYLEGAASDYGGVAQSGALDKVVVAKGVGTAVDSGATGAVGAGELVVGGIITGASPTSATPGSTQGQTFTMRAQTASGSVDIEDVLASSAGTQNARATLGTSADWYAVAAVFRGAAGLPPPTSLTASPVSTSQIGLSWTGSGGATGYKIQRSLNGSTGWAQVGTSITTTFTDTGLSPSTTYFYRVVASNGTVDSVPSNVASATTATPLNYVAGTVGTDNGLWVLHAGSSWTSLGGVLIGAPAVVAIPQSSGPAVPLYIATGSDHGLWVRNDSHGWQSFGGAPIYCIDNPGAAVIAGTLYVACQGQDHALWHAETPAPSGTNLPSLDPKGWQSLGGILAAGPTVASVAGKPTYFVTGTDQHIYSRDLSSGFVGYSWTCTGHPAVATYGSTSYFACHGTDNALWYATNSGSGWSPAQGLGGVLTDGVGLAATSTGPIFFVEGTDQHVWQRTITSGWTSDGGQIILGVEATAL